MEGSVARIEAWLRARDAARFQEDMRRSGKEVRDLGAAGRVAAGGLTMVRTTAASAASVLGAAGRAARYLGYGLGALGIAAVKWGLDFNSTMEQNTVAFKHFLGSTKAAESYLRRLYQLAATTPFEFAGLTTAAKRMIAFGFSAEGALKTLRTIGDAVSGLGSGQEGIDRMVIAFGQIKASGVLRGQDLLQLQQAGISTTKYLKEAGLATSGDVGKIGLLHIPANKGIKAIVEGMNRDFGGLSKAQSKTWQGLVSTIKDYTKQMLGDITKPLFDIGRKKVLPEIAKTTQEISKIFRTQGKPLEWKLARSREIIERNFGPLWNDIKQWWSDHHVGDWLTHAFETVLGKLLSLAVAAVPKIIGAFANAWTGSGLWGKLFLTGWLFKKTGVWKALGAFAATQFMRSFGGGRLGGGGGGVVGNLTARGSTPANPLYVWVVNGGGPGGKIPPVVPPPAGEPPVVTPASLASKLLRLGEAGPAALVAALGGAAYQAGGKTPYQRKNRLGVAEAQSMKNPLGGLPPSGLAPADYTRPGVHPRTIYIGGHAVGQTDPRLDGYPDSHMTHRSFRLDDYPDGGALRRAAVTTRPAAIPLVLPPETLKALRGDRITIVKIDGREVAKAVARDTDTERARR